MSKKHYIEAAAIVRQRIEYADTLDAKTRPYVSAVVTGIARDLADMFAAENPAFDRERFLTACGFDLWAGMKGAA